MNKKPANIDWECRGKFSFTTGFEPTKAESALANYASVIAPIIMYFVLWRELDWSVGQLILAAVLLLDMVGGVLTNSLNSMKRFLHTDKHVEVNWLGKWIQSKIMFPLMHLHLFAIPAMFDVSWSYAIFWYAFMAVSALIIHFTPLYLQRPVGLFIVMLTIMISQMAFKAPIGLEWLVPLFIIKLVFSHGVREEPYRP